MAKQVIVFLIDDVDATTTSTVSTRTFTLDGVRYEIDLSDTNAARLRASLEPWIRRARRVKGPRRRGPYVSNGPAVDDPAAARKWALDNGYDLSPVGRLPADIAAAYLRAQ